MPWTILLLGALAGASATSTSQESEHPNIVLIISDDQDYEHLGFMGNDVVKMPHLDSLAEQGTVFTTAYVPMSRCRGSLASLLTGRWPHQHGVTNNRSHRTLRAETSLLKPFSEAGYATFVAGKFWEPEHFDLGFEAPTKPGRNTFVRKNQNLLFQFIEKNAGKRPLFIWWAPMLPHGPFDAPDRYRERFDPADIPIPAYYGGDPAAFRAKEHDSLANEAWFDAGLGKFLTKLREEGVYENTLFAFLIDNGWANGLPSKGSAFEKGLRTPIFFTWPGHIEAGQRRDQLVSSIDVFPTLLDLVGLEVPHRIAGKSLLLPLADETAAGRSALYGGVYRNLLRSRREESEQDVYALYVRTARWKYVLYLKNVIDGETEVGAFVATFPARRRGDEDLFDLEADPHELADLAETPEHDHVRARLRAEVLTWWRKSGGGELKVP